MPRLSHRGYAVGTRPQHLVARPQFEPRHLLEAVGRRLSLCLQSKPVSSRTGREKMGLGLQLVYVRLPRTPHNVAQAERDLQLEAS